MPNLLPAVLLDEPFGVLRAENMFRVLCTGMRWLSSLIIVCKNTVNFVT